MASRGTSSSRSGMIEVLDHQRDAIVDRGLARIRHEIPAYAAMTSPSFVADVREHVDLHHEGVTRSLGCGHALRREDLGFVRPRASRRVGQIPLDAFMQAFRIYQEELWDAMVSASDGAPARDAALDSVGIVIRYMNLGAAEAAQAYLDAEGLLMAQGERVRRDLLEDLLAGRMPAPGAKLNAAREAGLVPATASVLIAAHPVSAPEGRDLRSVGLTLSRAVGTALSPLTVVRQDEVVIVASVERSIDEIIERLDAAREALVREGMPMAIGVSTLQEGLARMRAAYDEALAALEGVRTTGGVVALPALSALDCLAMFGTDTARRRINPAIRRFVAEDLAEEGVLTATLLEYVAADLNTKVAAERLFVHPNTARYRLARIEERTGCNLRSISDVVDLLIALRVEPRDAG